MKHLIKGRKLNRTASHKKAMMNNIVTALFKHRKITTTLSKAKEMSPLVDKLIGLAKRGDLHSRRQVLSRVKDNDVVKKLFDIVAPRFNDRNGGYTRILKLEQRVGDGVLMAQIELVE